MVCYCTLPLFIISHHNSYLLNSIRSAGHRPRTELEGRETRETLGADHFSTIIPNIITIFVLERLEEVEVDNEDDRRMIGRK